jgi:LacI family transcriptional regulator, repressor for deo operon, udp, cdd, tsx, nupC, and nupG
MRRSKQGVTMADVAREAGVSLQTVSRVINGRHDVSPATRQHIEDIIQRLGYQPNALARGLASTYTRTLGFVTNDFSDYTWTQIMTGAEHEARAHGYFLMIGSAERDPNDEPEYLRLLSERQVDGILFGRESREVNDSRYNDFFQQVPAVTVAYYPALKQVPTVDVDNVSGGRQAAEYLLSKGHRHIAMITGPEYWKAVQDRYEGYRQALEAASIPVDDSIIVIGDFSYQSGYKATQQLLSYGIPFSAIFAQSDQMAIGAIRALREAGMRIPQDVAIIGYDDIPAAAYCYPPLTTIRQPLQELGRIATQLLIKIVEGDNGVVNNEVLLRTEVIERASA